MYFTFLFLITSFYNIVISYGLNEYPNFCLNLGYIIYTFIGIPHKYTFFRISGFIHTYNLLYYVCNSEYIGIILNFITAYNFYLKYNISKK